MEKDSNLVMATQPRVPSAVGQLLSAYTATQHTLSHICLFLYLCFWYFCIFCNWSVIVCIHSHTTHSFTHFSLTLFENDLEEFGSRCANNFGNSLEILGNDFEMILENFGKKGFFFENLPHYSKYWVHDWHVNGFVNYLGFSRKYYENYCRRFRK